MIRSKTRRLRVVSRIYAPEPSAASQRLLSLVRGLKSAGIQVAVLSARVASTGAEDAGVEPHGGISRVPVLRDSSGYVRGYLPYMSFDLQAMVRVLFGRRTDAIVVEPPPTTGLLVGAAAWIRRIPYVYYAADIWSDASAQTNAHPLVVHVVRWIERRALRGATAVLAVTDEVAGRVRALAPNADVTVVGHGVDTEVYWSERRSGSERVDLVYVGSMSEWHGARVLIQALRLLPVGSVKAVIIGQGSEWAAMRAEIDSAGLADHVQILSTVPAAEAAEWLRRATVSVATLRPGAGYDFAVPTKLYSSVAVGTPVIYAGPDPVRSLVNAEKLGWGVEYDPSVLAQTIRDVIATAAADHLRDHVAAWALENVSARVVVGRSVAAIERVIARPAN